MKRALKILILFCSITTTVGLGYGLVRATQSPLFTVKHLMWAMEGDIAPLDEDSLTRLADISLGKESLFRLNLGEVEQRLLSNDWIEEVQFKKKYFDSLKIAVRFRKPAAYFQLKRGQMAYVNQSGEVFGAVNLLAEKDLPILFGLNENDPDRIRTALRIVDRWKEEVGKETGDLSSVHWAGERGYRVMAIYPIRNARMRTWIDLGDPSEDHDWGERLGHVSRVLEYLSRNLIATHRIWADHGKKVVVKTSHGS